MESGFKPEEPTIWIVEGLFYYLTEAQARGLMARIHELSATGSCIGCDLLNWAACNGDDEWAKFWEFGCDVPEEFFGGYGWDAIVIQPGDGETGRGRDNYPLPPPEEVDKENVFWVTALKASKR